MILWRKSKEKKISADINLWYITYIRRIGTASRNKKNTKQNKKHREKTAT